MSARRTVRTLILAALASPWLADAGAAPGIGRIEEIIAPRVVRLGINFAF